VTNDDAIIVRCKFKDGDKTPFRLFKFPTIKLFKLPPAQCIIEYFGDPENIDSYKSFLRDEGSIDWFDGART
jgi:hypothetical protein